MRNIHEKIRIPKLKEELHKLFSPYGTVLEVVAHKNLRLKGQAFVVFDTIDEAEKGLALNDTKVDTLRGSTIQVQYAKTASDATVAKEAPEELDAHKRSRLARKELRQAREAKENPKRAAESEASRPAKKQATSNEFNPVHRILLLQNLPKDASQESVSALFSSLPGYIEVRLVPARQVGFAEFESDEQAVLAKEKTHLAEVDGEKMTVHYAKK